MLKPNLTKEQEDIIRNICDLQIQSLLRVSMDNGVAQFFNKVGILIPQDFINSSISNFLVEFNKIKGDPSRVLMIQTGLLSLIKHHLFYCEDNDHKSKLWKKITIAEEFQINQN